MALLYQNAARYQAEAEARQAAAAQAVRNARARNAEAAQIRAQEEQMIKTAEERLKEQGRYIKQLRRSIAPKIFTQIEAKLNELKTKVKKLQPWTNFSTGKMIRKLEDLLKKMKEENQVIVNFFENIGHYFPTVRNTRSYNVYTNKSRQIAEQIDRVIQAELFLASVTVPEIEVIENRVAQWQAAANNKARAREKEIGRAHV